MLNELLTVERGARAAGFHLTQRHPDVKVARQMSTLVVRLDKVGNVVSVRPLTSGIKPWTLRDGQHNSFPFVQPRYPLWTTADNDEQRKAIVDKTKDEQRASLVRILGTLQLTSSTIEDWPGAALLKRLRERKHQLASLNEIEVAAVVPATIDCFLAACDRSIGGDPEKFMRNVVHALVENLRETAEESWLRVAVALLIGERKEDQWRCNGALLLEADGFHLSIADQKLIEHVSDALNAAIPVLTQVNEFSICGLTGTKVRLLSGSFPQPTLPGLGQTYLFAKNKDIPANDRYGRFAADAMPVGQDVVNRLEAALRELTQDYRENVTWRRIPGEATKQTDLLLAFVQGVPEASAVEALAEEDQVEGPLHTTANVDDSIAAFEKRTQRLLDLVKVKLGGDVTKTPVQIAVFRKVDPANRKIVYTGTQTVNDLYTAAIAWASGERNVPSWLTLPVLTKGEPKPRPMSPPHVAPLGLIAFSKQNYCRGGIERQQVPGFPAAEVLRLFFYSSQEYKTSSYRHIGRMLRLVLARRSALIVGTAHALRRGFDVAKEFDRREALRTVTLLGVLLHKLKREEEAYMSETAFKLGQLLAAADLVHVGYCAAVRKGDMPPSLLGNQVFTVAQSDPTKALAIFCRRWKPYDGWAKKANRGKEERESVENLIKSKQKNEQQRGWDIKKALRYAREMGPLAAELAPALDACHVDDVFRAKLLLGYIAGLPKAQKDDEDERNQTQVTQKED